LREPDLAICMLVLGHLLRHGSKEEEFYSDRSICVQSTCSYTGGRRRGCRCGGEVEIPISHDLLPIRIGLATSILAPPGPEMVLCWPRSVQQTPRMVRCLPRHLRRRTRRNHLRLHVTNSAVTSQAPDVLWKRPLCIDLEMRMTIMHTNMLEESRHGRWDVKLLLLTLLEVRAPCAPRTVRHLPRQQKC
jgi:hypothetical protein